jgi:hypothetical protein
LVNRQEQKISIKLKTGFISYTKATTSLQNRIEAAVKLKASKEKALSAIRRLTGNKLNFNNVGITLDRFVNAAGLNMGKRVQFEKLIK